MSLKRRVDKLTLLGDRDDALFFHADPNWTRKDHAKALANCRDTLGLDEDVPVWNMPLPDQAFGIGAYIPSLTDFFAGISQANIRIGGDQ